ncbi:MAG: class I tRNA ligase family protein, partial [Firmicutes bacterium]|nr:class I tRNA ligase family protein [Bacillota bacterium]
DEDVLDTWFSSALWPFSTLGWPDKTDDLARYYPTDTMVTGYDIIFFWVARMIFQGLEFTNVSPFKHCLIHGLIRDSEGRKMSKSLGNGVDPLEIKAKYGIDTLRYFLTTNSAPGADLRFEIEKVESSWNFINKLWNISRFTLMNLGEFTVDDVEFDTDELDLPAQWILARLHQTITDMDYNYDKFEFGEAARAIHNFSWDDFASWYVEIAKISLNSDDEFVVNRTKSILSYVLLDMMKLLHPFMPFVTEEIYQKIPHLEESIMISSWPEALDEFQNSTAIKDFSLIQEIIKAIRNIRAEYNVLPSKKINVFIQTKDEYTTNLLDDNILILEKFINPEEMEINQTIVTDTEVISLILGDVTLYLPLGSLVDIQVEIERLEKELVRLEQEILRCEQMLGNERFTSKAPADKVKLEQDKLASYQDQYKTIASRLDEIRK